MATLLVAVVGATFAYFTATNETTGREGGQTQSNTAKVGNSTFTLTNNTADEKLGYPGGIALIKATAKAVVDSDNATDANYDFKYNLKITASGDFGTTLNWHLYELDQSTESTANSALNEGSGFNIDSCELVKDDTQGDGNIYYYYTKDGSSYESVEEINDTNSCTAKTLGFEAQIGNRKIATGTLTSTGVTGSTGDSSSIGDEAPSVNAAEGVVTISNLEIKNVTNSTGVSKYYYLVVEYPNNEDQTTTDKEKHASIHLELVEDSVEVSVNGAA